MSRYARFGGEGELPTIGYGAHLINALWKVGPTNRDGSPVSWSEVEAYSRLTRSDFDSWDAETLHAMSEAYAVYAIKARNKDCQSPWKPAYASPSEVNEKIKSFFGPRKKKPASSDTGRNQRIPKQQRS